MALLPFPASSGSSGYSGTARSSGPLLPGSVALAVGLLLAPGCRSDTNLVTKQPTEEEEEVVVEPFSNDWGQWLAMDVLPDGRPVAAFYDATEGGVGFAIATIASDGSVTWSYEEPDGYPDAGGFDAGDRGKYVAMAVAPSGDVWLAYLDVANDNLRYARRYYLSGNWENGLADAGSGPGTASGYFPSIAIDQANNPVIAHYDQGNGELRVARWAGAAFTGEVVDSGVAPEVADGEEPVDADVGAFSSIGIVNGVEYITYYDAANGDLMLATGASGGYAIERVDTEGDVGAWTNLAISDGTLHIAYHDKTEQDLMYASGTPGNFDIEVVDDAKYVGADTDILLVGGSPRIAYFDGYWNDMKVAVKAGEGWAAETVAGDSGPLGFHNELITVGDRVYAGCYDYAAHSVWFSALP